MTPSVSSPHRPRSLADWARLWFGFEARVGRRAYAVTGLTLMVVKVVGDYGLLWEFERRFWDPLAYFSPVGLSRFTELDNGPLLASIALWALPFIWIGASMTVRRAVDAGLSPAVGLLFFVPGIHWVVLVILCFASSAATPIEARVFPSRPVQPTRLDATFFGAIGWGALIALVIFGVGVGLARDYGYGLFLGAPFVQGLAVALVLCRQTEPGTRRLVGAVATSVVVAGGALLLFGLEGLLCIAMAAPLAFPLAIVGGLLGRAVHRTRALGSVPMGMVMMVVPLQAGLVPSPEPPLREVISTIEIDRPPAAVWPKVTQFTEMAPPSWLPFRMGIAYPIRARYVGTGTRAIRYCEFSTGAFVEPITVWDAPHRLAFDVIEQPPTLEEWSPYAHLDPAHVTQSLRSERGEFRLVPLPGGRTRLEGSTWYRQALFPQAYWTLWSDAIIHAIHERVLAHIRQTVEHQTVDVTPPSDVLSGTTS